VQWIEATRTVIINTGTDKVDTPQDHGKLVELLFNIMTELIGTDLFIDTSIEILAFDFSEMSILTALERQALLSSLKTAYGFNTIQAAIDELYVQGYISKGMLYFQKGLLFTFTNIEVRGDSELIFSISIWRGPQSTNFFVDYEAKKAADGSWTYTIGDELIV
jgi:hypothetical protein